MTFAVVLTDVSGTLGATASGTGQATGEGTDVLTLTGGLADINAELASLTYTGVAAGTDTIDVTTYDGVGLADDHQIAVAVSAPTSVPLPPGLGMAALYQNIFGQMPSAATLAAGQAALGAGQTLAQVAAPWIAQAQATIAALCEQVQGTSPTASVLASLMQALIGGEGVAQIRASLAGSSTTQSELARVYQGHYGIDPTTAQLDALTQQLASGTSLEAVEAPLLANSQAEAQIAALYQQVEGQAPAASDLVTGARALLNGTPLATVRNQLAMSPLVQDDLAVLYQHVYDQTPTAAQLAPFTTELASTTTYAGVQAQFTALAQAEVTSIYQSVLGRTPTVWELSTNTQGLINGTSMLFTIRPGLAYSVEFCKERNDDVSERRVAVSLYGDGDATGAVSLRRQEPLTLAQLGTDLASAALIYQQTTGRTANEAALTPLIQDYFNNTAIHEIDVQGGGSTTMSAIVASISKIVLESAGNPYTFTANTTQGLVINAGADAATVTVGSASQTVNGSGGSLHVLATAANAGAAVKGGTGSKLLEVITGGTVALNSADNNLTVQLDAASTLSLPTNTTVAIDGGTGNDVLVATSGVLRTGQQIDGGSGVNTLALQGGGSFNLAAPSVLNNIQVVTATEGQSAGQPTIYLRNGTNLTLNLAPTPTSPQSAAAVIYGANNNDVINLGSGKDTVYLGGTGEIVNGGGGNDTFYVTGATVGATIAAGSSTNVLDVQGGGSVVMGTNITGIDTVSLQSAGNPYTFTANTTQGLVINAGADAATVTVGSASQTVNGSGGSLHVLATAANAGAAVKGGTGSKLLEVITGGTVALNSADNNLTVQLDAASTLSLPTNTTVAIDGGTGNDVLVATSGVLRTGQQIDGGSGVNTLALQGGGSFNLAAPSVLNNIQVVTATEGQSAGQPTIYLRNGTNLTLNLAPTPTSPQSAAAVIYGANNNDVINLGSGKDTIYLGGTGEIVNGGSGNDTFYVTGATVGATIAAGSSTNVLDVQGGGSVVMGTNITGIDTVSLQSAGNPYTFTANTTQGLVINAGADAATVTVGSASQTVNGSGGSLHVLATAANAGAAVKGGTGSKLLEVITGGTVALNSADNNLTVQLDAASTLSLPTNTTVAIDGGTGNDVLVATSGVLRTGPADRWRQRGEHAGASGWRQLQPGRTFGAQQHSGSDRDRRAIGRAADHLPEERHEPDAEPGAHTDQSSVGRGGHIWRQQQRRDQSRVGQGHDLSRWNRRDRQRRQWQRHVLCDGRDGRRNHRCRQQVLTSWMCKAVVAW